jgi:hypothetical protein
MFDRHYHDIVRYLDRSDVRKCKYKSFIPNVLKYITITIDNEGKSDRVGGTFTNQVSQYGLTILFEQNIPFILTGDSTFFDTICDEDDAVMLRPTLILNQVRDDRDAFFSCIPMDGCLPKPGTAKELCLKQIYDVAFLTQYFVNRRSVMYTMYSPVGDNNLFSYLRLLNYHLMSDEHLTRSLIDRFVNNDKQDTLQYYQLAIYSYLNFVEKLGGIAFPKKGKRSGKVEARSAFVCGNLIFSFRDVDANQSISTDSRRSALEKLIGLFDVKVEFENSINHDKFPDHSGSIVGKRRARKLKTHRKKRMYERYKVWLETYSMSPSHISWNQLLDDVPNLLPATIVCEAVIDMKRVRYNLPIISSDVGYDSYIYRARSMKTQASAIRIHKKYVSLIEAKVLLDFDNYAFTFGGSIEAPLDIAIFCSRVSNDVLSKVSRLDLESSVFEGFHIVENQFRYYANRCGVFHHRDEVRKLVEDNMPNPTNIPDLMLNRFSVDTLRLDVKELFLGALSIASGYFDDYTLFRSLFRYDTESELAVRFVPHYFERSGRVIVTVEVKRIPLLFDGRIELYHFTLFNVDQNRFQHSIKHGDSENHVNLYCVDPDSGFTDSRSLGTSLNDLHEITSDRFKLGLYLHLVSEAIVCAMNNDQLPDHILNLTDAPPNVPTIVEWFNKFSALDSPSLESCSEFFWKTLNVTPPNLVEANVPRIVVQPINCASSFVGDLDLHAINYEFECLDITAAYFRGEIAFDGDDDISPNHRMIIDHSDFGQRMQLYNNRLTPIITVDEIYVYKRRNNPNAQLCCKYFRADGTRDRRSIFFDESWDKTLAGSYLFNLLCARADLLHRCRKSLESCGYSDVSRFIKHCVKYEDQMLDKSYDSMFGSVDDIGLIIELTRCLIDGIYDVKVINRRFEVILNVFTAYRKFREDLPSLRQIATYLTTSRDAILDGFKFAFVYHETDRSARTYLAKSPPNVYYPVCLLEIIGSHIDLNAYLTSNENVSKYVKL